MLPAIRLTLVCLAVSLLVLFWVVVSACAAELPRVESGGRVVILDDFEQDLEAWEGDAEIEIAPGPGPGNHVLVWRCTDVSTTLRYKLTRRIPDLPRYTRFALDIRAFSEDGLIGPGVATSTSVLYGGVPWQIADLPPSWGLYDRRPVFGDTWRSLSEWTDYPDWYVFFQPYDNTQPNLQLSSQVMFGTSGTVMIDNLRLIADPVEVLGREQGGVWGEGRWLSNGGYRYDYHLRLRNLTDQPQSVRALLDRRLLRRFRAGMMRDSITLKPRQRGALAAYVEVPREALDQVRDLYHEELLVTLETEGAPGTEHVVPLLATKPLPHRQHPFILHPPDWWPAQRERLAALSAEERAKELAPAEDLLDQELVFPSYPTVFTPRPRNDGTQYHRPSWSEADYKTFMGNFAALRKLGEAYQKTFDERYARQAVAMLEDFARKYPSYPPRATVAWAKGNARIALNNLHESYWIQDLAGSYDLFLDSPSLTPETRALIRRRLLLPAARYQTTITSGFSNQTSSRYAAGALFGMLAEDANLLQYAVYGHHGLAISAEVSISPDGFLTEIPINYHWANLREMLTLPLVCRNAGVNMEVATERIRKACDTPYLRAMPNLNAPPFGSCGYGIGANFGLGNYPRVAELFGLPLYEQLATPEGAREIIDGLPSLAFIEGGLVVLREKGRTGLDRTYLAILSTNSRRAADQTLHFVLYSDGDLLCPSPGTLYNAHADATWVSPWPSTILVDGQPQRTSLGRILAHDFSGEPQMALLDAGGIAPGVSLQRAVALAEGLVFVVDRASSEKEHTYDRVQMARQEIVRPPAEPTELELNHGENIRFRGTRLDRDWDLQWQIPGGPGLEFRMVGEAGTQVFWGANQVNAYKPQMYAPTVVARRQAKSTVFLNVMEPFRDRAPHLRGVRRVKVLAGDREATEAEAVAVTALTDRGEFVFVVNFDATPKTCEGHLVTESLALFQVGR
jgi:hypothetical protein